MPGTTESTAPEGGLALAVDGQRLGKGQCSAMSPWHLLSVSLWERPLRVPVDSERVGDVDELLPRQIARWIRCGAAPFDALGRSSGNSPRAPLWPGAPVGRSLESTKTDPRVGLTSGSPPDEGGRQEPPADLCLPCAALHSQECRMGTVYAPMLVSASVWAGAWKGSRPAAACRTCRGDATAHSHTAESCVYRRLATGRPRRPKSAQINWSRGCSRGCRPPIRASLRLLRLEKRPVVSVRRAKAALSQLS
jgi:hypothetical protein